MKRRLHKIANFFAFNLLFFALYLNFIHRDKPMNDLAQPAAQVTSVNENTVMVKGVATYVDPKTTLSQQEASATSR